MTPRVLFLDHVGVLGGAELSLLDIARGLGGSCRVLLFQEGPFAERLAASGVDVEVVPAPAALLRLSREGGGWSDVQALPGLAAFVREVTRRAQAFDVLYANSQKAFAVAAWAGRRAGRPVIWHLRDLFTDEHFSRRRRRVAVAMGNRLAARVLANSEATARAYVASGGRPGRVQVVHNGVDPRPFSAVTDAAAAAVRRALGLDDAPVVGCFSRLAPWKGQHVLLEALAHVPDVQALLVGEALFGEEAVYAETLRRQAAALPRPGRVHFTGFRSDVPALMRCCDVVVHTSVAPEPFGRVIVEGQLAGRPVVASRAGGAVEIVADGRTGLLTPPGDARALADALRGLLRDPERAAALAAAGREDALRRFTLDALLRNVTTALREVAAG